MSKKEEFVRLARTEGANRRDLCRRFGISPTLGYKLLQRFETEGVSGLKEHSRRPRSSPSRTLPEIEAAILAIRDEHSRWGGRKIAARMKALGKIPAPAASTVTEVLRRHNRLGEGCSGGQSAFISFEHEAPNELWQMDFKGHFQVGGGRCHPLTVLDDHSRFNLCLAACANEQTQTVQDWLTVTFRRYGMPERMTMDNGSPWGEGPGMPYTQFTVWLMRLGIRISHSRPYHPQTQGKDERFHRTLKAEVLEGKIFRNIEHCQVAFDHWRDVYNLERPHESLDLMPPITRYRPAERAFPEILPVFEYGPDDYVRIVQDKGLTCFKGKEVKLPGAFKGQRIAFRPTNEDGVWNACFGSHKIAQIDLRKPVA